LRELALHILDIAENSVNAGASMVRISIHENTLADRLSFSLTDNGRGMDEELINQVLDPFYTTRTTRRVGLGLPLLKAAAELCNGGLTITSTVNKGSRVSCWFQHSHIDRMPLGDLVSTMTMLLIGYPDIHWIYRYEFNNRLFEFDDEYFKKELGAVALSEPSIISFLRGHLEEGMRGVREPLPLSVP
jgi:hypothetical protein